MECNGCLIVIYCKLMRGFSHACQCLFQNAHINKSSTWSTAMDQYTTEDQEAASKHGDECHRKFGIAGFHKPTFKHDDPYILLASLAYIPISGRFCFVCHSICLGFGTNHWRCIFCLCFFHLPVHVFLFHFQFQWVHVHQVWQPPILAGHFTMFCVHSYKWTNLTSLI